MGVEINNLKGKSYFPKVKFSLIMNDYYIKDLKRYGGLQGIKGLAQGLLFPGFTYTLFFRKASLHHKKSLLGIFYRIILRHLSCKYGIQIPAGTRINEGFYIGHFGNIVVSSKCIIGKNCNIAQGVTIGMANRGARAGAPIIGDRVWIGANSVVVGNIKIGNNVLIAPLSYINFDIPDNSVVINGVVRENLEATKDYINNIV